MYGTTNRNTGREFVNAYAGYSNGRSILGGDADERSVSTVGILEASDYEG
jgi:hypothetical protein